MEVWFVHPSRAIFVKMGFAFSTVHPDPSTKAQDVADSAPAHGEEQHQLRLEPVEGCEDLVLFFIF